MRQILVEYARGPGTAKRGGNSCRLTLDEALDLPMPPEVDVIALDKALTELSEMDEPGILTFVAGAEENRLRNDRVWRAPPPAP
jgi:hypothetical protein